MKFLTALIFVFCGVISTHIYAEEVRVPIAPQATASMSNLPRSGMSMSQVESQYGQPNSKQGPVGEPPISFWEFPDYTVYFEFENVIHTVSKVSRLSK